ncbi:MAG: dipeptidase [Oscillospiraceae bacterium]
MSIPYFDAHCDTLSRRDNPPLRENGGQLDLKRLGAFACAGQVFAIFANAGHFAPGALLPECRRQHERFVSELAKNSDLAVQCRTAAEAEAAFRAHKTAALLSIEGAELLNCDPGLLAEAESWGVRMLNLTWNHPNALSGANIREAERGLSAQGRDFVREAERRHILMDVSHLSERGFWDLMEVSSAPAVASHSNLKALCDHPRNLTDAQFKALVEKRGFVGLNVFAAFVGERPDMDALVAHVERAWELGGEDTLGLGGDWDGCDVLAAGFAGVQDLPRLYEALQRRNHSDALLYKLFCGNLLRVLA